MENKWLTARAEVLMKYANELPNAVDKVTINIAAPDAGWIDFYFNVNGKEVTVLDTSCVYEPFLPLRCWLEFLITDWFETNASITLDLESNRVTLSYEPILHPGDFSDNKPYPRNCGIFTIYDSWTDKMVLTAYCDNLEFVSMFYHTLLRYAVANAYNKEFVEGWIDDAYNSKVSELETDEEHSQFFIDLVKSPLIEDFYNNKYQFELKELKTKYRKQIDKKLQDASFAEADLTNDEMMQLIEEIKCEENGGLVLDGFLFFKDIYSKHSDRRFDNETGRAERDWKKQMKSKRNNRIFDESPTGHATHWRTVCDGTVDDILDNLIYSLFWVGSGSISINGKKLEATAERGSNLWVTGERVLVEKEGEYIVETAYPSFKKGGDVKSVLLKSINEHHNGLEALLTVEFAGQEFCFFDLDYIANKDMYQVGKHYDFTMAAFAYDAKTMPKAEQIEPFKQSGTYEDDYDFASSVKGTIYHLELKETKILRIPISITSPDKASKEIIIPLLAKAELFKHEPTIGEMIRGNCWFTGRLINKEQ